MFDLSKRSGENSDKGEQRVDEHQTEFHWLLKASVTSSVDAIAINYNPPTDWQGKVLEDAMAADFGSNVLNFLEKIMFIWQIWPFLTY